MAGVIALAFLIFVHELGHFLTAKLFNIEVFRFSIGFGKVLFRKKFGETTYQLALIPFGGFVEMRGETSSEAIGPPSPRAFSSQAPWKRAVVLFAGPFMNLSLAYLLLGVVVMSQLIELDKSPFLVFSATFDLISYLFDALGTALSNMAHGNTESLGGPVTIISELTKSASKNMIDYAFHVGFMSLQLGLLNLLPIPVLDGGHLLVIALESCFRRQLPEKAKLALSAVGMLFIFSLMILAISLDFRKFL